MNAYLKSPRFWMALPLLVIGFPIACFVAFERGRKRRIERNHQFHIATLPVKPRSP